MKIRQNAFVVFDRTTCTDETYEKYYKDLFGEKLFIFFGEVPQAPGHCILGDLKTGKIIGMYHTNNFREANEEEV